MSKILTAEQFVRKELETLIFINKFEQGEIDELISSHIEFAKLHVTAALKEALESIPCLGSSSDIATYEEVENAVLNAYPLSNIK